MILHYELPSGSELIDHLPLAKPYKRYTVYSLALPDLEVGDIVWCQSQIEATNDLGFNVVFSHAMMVHTKRIILSGALEWPKDGAEYHWQWVRPAVPCGENITPDIHHSSRWPGGAFTVKQKGTHWVSLIAYSSSTAASAGDKIKIESYGGLSAVVFRDGPVEVSFVQNGTFSGKFNEDGTMVGTYEV